jgi:tetratricopeptide (TPR) repeat protein
VREAIGHFDEALRIQPDHVTARLRLALVLATLGDLDEAIRHYEIALEYEPDNAAANFNLGIALERRGRPKEAVEHYRAALRLASASNQRELADAIRDRIERHWRNGSERR